MAAMTGRERVNRMLQRRDHDRVPRFDAYFPEAIARWQTEGFAGEAPDVLALLSADFLDFCWSFPAPYRDGERLVSQTDEWFDERNEFGETVRYFRDPTRCQQHLSYEADCRAAWEQYTKPALLAPELHVDLEEAELQWALGRRSGRWCFLIGIDPFQAGRHLLGDEVMLLAMAADPEWIRDLSVTYTDLVLRDWSAIVEAGLHPDGVWIASDLAYQLGPLCSPQMYRELILPDHRRLCEWAHAHSLQVIFHSNGKVHDLLDDWVAIGVDLLVPLQAQAGMELGRIGRSHGRRLGLMGNIDTTILAAGDPGRIEAEVATKLAAGKATGGYAFCCDQMVGETISWASYRLLIELLARYGSYS